MTMFSTDERRQLDAVGKQRCTSCKEVKLHEDFGTCSQKTNGRTSQCRRCRSIKAIESRLKGTGWTAELYMKIHEEQDGRCYICGKKCQFGRLVADHCHKTNQRRGLLCRNCNRALGFFSDDPDILEAAAAYLRDHMEREQDDAA